MAMAMEKSRMMLKLQRRTDSDMNAYDRGIFASLHNLVVLLGHGSA